MLQDVSIGGPSFEVRQVAITALGKYAGAFQFLRELAEAPNDTQIRCTAIQVIGEDFSYHIDTFDALCGWVKVNEDETVREKALWKLFRGALRMRTFNWDPLALLEDDPELLFALKDAWKGYLEKTDNGWADNPKLVSVLQELASKGDQPNIRTLAANILRLGWPDYQDSKSS